MKKGSVRRQFISMVEREFTKKHSFLSNNLKTFVIHGTVLVAGIPFLLLALLNMLPVALIGPILYVFLGYRFLHPLPKYNWLSVAGLPILLGLLLITLFGAEHFWGNSFVGGTMQVGNFIFVMNYQAIMLVIATIAFLNYFINDFLLGNYMFAQRDFLGDDFVAMAALAILLPSLLMYAGLLLKMWKQRRSLRSGE